MESSNHVLIIPFPGQGHLIPTLDFTHHLINRGIKATVVITPINLPLLEPLMSLHPLAVSPLTLPLPPHPSLPANGENTKDLPPACFDSILAALPGLQDPILRWFANHPSPPSAIISDLMLGWTQHLGEMLGIKRFYFSVCGALSISLGFSLIRNLPTLHRIETGEIDQNGVVSVTDFLSLSEFSFWQLPAPFRVYLSGGPIPEAFTMNSRDNVAWGFIFNTFSGLEGAYLDNFKGFLGHDRVWSVGPLFTPKSADSDASSRTNARGGASLVGDKVLSWLDTCADDEVVYISFGTQEMLTQEQIQVLALALEKSGVRFIWKFKEPVLEHVDTALFGKLPIGFEERVAGRGLVVREWVSQISILKHRAVGSFMTHCGWNAVLEGVSAGVIFLAWPYGADNFFGSKVLLDIHKVGVKVGHDTRQIPDPNELATILVKSTTKAYKEERSRAKELMKEATQANTQNGTSFKDLDMLAHHLTQLPKPDPNAIVECQRWIEKKEIANGTEIMH